MTDSHPGRVESALTSTGTLLPETTFRHAMRHIPASVAIVTAGDGRRRYGLTATSVTTVSARPPQMLVCADARSRSAAAITSAQLFAINYLAPHHESMAKSFAQQHDSRSNKFNSGQWNDVDPPVLTDAVVSLTCTLVQTITSATHAVFIGRVREINTDAGPALLYRAGQFSEF
jgi:flavin reductase